MNSISTLYRSKLFLACELTVLIVFPLILIYLYPPIIRYRVAVMLGGLVYALFVARLLGFSTEMIGITKKNFLISLRDLAVPTLITILIISIIYQLFPTILYTPVIRSELGDHNIYPILLRYILTSVPVQEIALRTFLIPRLEFVSPNKLFLILTSSIIFGTIHIPLGNTVFTIATYLLGLVWAANFVQYRNLFTLWLSHAVVGITFVYFVRLL